MMDFNIKRCAPDGITVIAEFYVDTWMELACLMEYLDDAESEVE